MESSLLGMILDSNVLVAAERKRQAVEELLTSVGQPAQGINASSGLGFVWNADHDRWIRQAVPLSVTL